jgi:hypothetical protein
MRWALTARRIIMMVDIDERKKKGRRLEWRKDKLI